MTQDEFEQVVNVKLKRLKMILACAESANVTFSYPMLIVALADLVVTAETIGTQVGRYCETFHITHQHVETAMKLHRQLVIEMLKENS